MRFLLDENLSPLLAELLSTAGHDAVHIRDLGLLTASDRIVLDRATSERRILISADTDFGELLAESGATVPSVILLRRERYPHGGESGDAPAGQPGGGCPEPSESGAIVVLEATRSRVRALPVRSDP